MAIGFDEIIEDILARVLVIEEHLMYGCNVVSSDEYERLVMARKAGIDQETRESQIAANGDFSSSFTDASQQEPKVGQSIIGLYERKTDSGPVKFKHLSKWKMLMPSDARLIMWIEQPQFPEIEVAE